jgi:hypothetical protein
MRIIPAVIIALLIAAGVFSSCRYNPVVTHPPCDTCNKPCDTCNLNQDSLQRIKDSLAHAFTWQQLSIPGETFLTGCWVFGPNDIYIVGNSLWHYDGVTFTLVPAIRTASNTTLNGALNGFHIFAFSKTDFWMIYSGIAFHTTDGQYFDDNRPGGVLNTCWGTSSNDMFFVGNGGLIYHYGGAKFDSVKSNTTLDLRMISGTSDMNIWAGGTNVSTGKIELLHYDGNQWQSDNFVKTADAQVSGIYGVWTIDSASTHITAINTGAYFFRKTDNGPWVRDNSVPNIFIDGSNILMAIKGTTILDFWTIGNHGWSAHSNDKTWKKQDSIYSPMASNFFTEAASVNGNTICFAGTKDGNSWVAIGTRKQ